MTSKDETRPTLSIITVCKDIAAEIGDTCDSVVRQTWRDFEWLVVDGASTDGTLAVLEKYRGRMTTLVSEPDRGVYHAMNKGIALARGEYLLFLNGGDYLASDTTLERVFAVRREADVLYGDELHLYPEDGQIEARKAPPAADLDKLFFAYDIINHQAAFIRRELFSRFGPYDEDLPIAADREKWVVFAARGCVFARLDMPLSVYRMRGGSSRNRFAEAHRRSVKQIRERHFSPEELRRAWLGHRERAGYRRVFAWGGNGKFSLFAIDETPDGRKRKYRFLNLPVLKLFRRGRVRDVLLFGFIKVWNCQAMA